MFLVNSRYRHFSATTLCLRREVSHITMVHLLPKLRCYFAEFLNQGSLKRLGILTPPTCVGLRYDHLKISPEVFLGSMGSMTSGLLSTASRLRIYGTRICLHSSLLAYTAYSNRRIIYPPASPRHSNDSTVVQEFLPVSHRLRSSASA